MSRIPDSFRSLLRDRSQAVDLQGTPNAVLIGAEAISIRVRKESSEVGGILGRFALGIKNSAGCRRGFRSPHSATPRGGASMGFYSTEGMST
jgi:hypothetical protein